MSVTKCIRKKDGKKKIFYRTQVYVSGVRVADQIFDTQSAAHTWHDQEKEKIENGINDDQNIEDIIFDECVNRYLTERLVRLEKSTRQTREAKIVHLRKCPLSNLKMSQIKARAVDLWLSWLLKQPTANYRKRRSFFNELKALSAILNWYRNYIDADFIVPITKRHWDAIRYKNVAPRRPDYFARPEEVRAWVEWLKGRRQPVYYRLAMFLVLTGTRIGEAAGMCWSEIDLDRRHARVVRVVVWDHKTRQPTLEERAKTDGSIRILMLPEILVDILREMKQEVGSSDGPIFVNQKGGLLKYNAIQSAFNAGFRASKLPWRSTHICRHTYATLALMATHDLGGVQAALGHKSQKMTEKYAKNVALLRSETAEKTASLLNFAVN